MKQSRIKKIIIHNISVTDERKLHIEYTLSKIYARHTAKMLDEMQLSNRQKADILKEILKRYSTVP